MINLMYARQNSHDNYSGEGCKNGNVEKTKLMAPSKELWLRVFSWKHTRFLIGPWMSPLIDHNIDKGMSEFDKKNILFAS